jgi:hypothetical protein
MDGFDYGYRLGENTRKRDYKVPEERLVYKANEFIPPTVESKSESTPINSLPNNSLPNSPEIQMEIYRNKEIVNPVYEAPPKPPQITFGKPVINPPAIMPSKVVKPIKYVYNDNRSVKSVESMPDNADQILGVIMRHMGNKLPVQIIRSYILKYRYLGGTDKWTKEKISGLLRELNNHYEESQINTQITSKIKPTMTPNLEIETGEFYEDTIKLVVRSDERNIIKYPQPTDFYISLFPPNGLSKVKEFKLLSCIFPKNTNEENLTINDYPYLILQIKEIGNQFVGKNGKITGFCPLTFTTDTGQFKIFHGETSPFTTKTIFPSKNLSGLSISFLLPNGEPFLFNPIVVANNSKKIAIKEELEYNPDPFSTPANKSALEITADSEGTTDNFPIITLLFEFTFLRKRENFANLY